MLTKKDLLEVLEDMPMDAEIVPHEMPFDWTPDTIAMVGYDAKKNEIILFDYYNYSIC